VLAPITAVEYLEAALTLASNHGLGVAIAERDLTHRPACSIELAENLSLLGFLAHYGALQGHT
jgi:hypothetical protein